MTSQPNQNLPFMFYLLQPDYEEADPNDPEGKKMITRKGSKGIEIEYGLDEQSAQNKLMERIGTSWPDQVVRSEGVDPLFAYRQSISNNFSPNNPYYTGAGATGPVNTNFTPRYATSGPAQTTGNPYFDILNQGQSNYLADFERQQEIDRTGQKQPQPWTDQYRNPPPGMTQGSATWTAGDAGAGGYITPTQPFQIPSAPQYNTQGGMQGAAGPWGLQDLNMGELPSSFDAPLSRDYGAGPSYGASVSATGGALVGPGRADVDAEFPPMKGGEKEGEAEEEPFRIENLDALRDQIVNALNATTGFGGFVNLGSNKLNALGRVGITQEMIQSNDINVLEDVRQRLLDTDVLQDSVFGTRSDMASQFLPGFLQGGTGSIFGDQERRALISQQNLREFEAPTPAETTEETTEETGLTTPGYDAITPGIYNEGLRALRSVQSGNQDAMLPKEIMQEALARPESIAADLVRQYQNAQEQMMPFGRALGQRQEMIDEYAQITKAERQMQTDILQSEMTRQTALDTAGISAQSADYRTAIDFAGTQMQIQAQERTANAQIRSAEMISQAGNQSQEYIAELQTNTTFDVARMNNMTQQEVALISSRTTLEAAEITGMTQRDVANIKGQFEQRIADATNLSREEIQRLQNASAREVADIQRSSNENVATINTMAQMSIATSSNATQGEIARMQTEATKNVAEANNTTELEIAKLVYSADATTLRGLELAEQQAIMKIQNDYAKEMVALGAAEGIQTTEEAIIDANNEAATDLQNAQLEYEKTKYEYENAERVKAELLLADERKTVRTAAETAATQARQQALDDAGTLRTQQITDLEDEYERSDKLLADRQEREDNLREAEQLYEAGLLTAEQEYQKELSDAEKEYQEQLTTEGREYQTGEREDIEAFQTSERTGTETAQMDIETLRVLGGYDTPQEFQTAQIELQRGGLSEEDDKSLKALLAAGGLTAEQRLAEISAETRSQEMNALLALLSNPQALGAFVTMMTGDLPFETVPTMGQLIDMTPSRIEYLQGALSALGIDPQTFIRMAQDVTPGAFQEAGPFGQLSAMIA